MAIYTSGERLCTLQFTSSDHLNQTHFGSAVLVYSISPLPTLFQYFLTT